MNGDGCVWGTVYLKGAEVSNEVTVTHNGKFKFGLQRLFALIATIAVLIWLSMRVYEWYVSVPLSTVVMAFNSRAAVDPALKSMVPLTEDEIVAAIQSQLKSPDYTSSREAPAISSMLTQIASTRRMPQNTWLEMNPVYHADSREREWRIDLNGMTSQNSGFAISIRRIPKPRSLGNDVEPAAFSFPASPLGGP
ncbi:MAG: hypothetical protein SGJ19_28370 [Planctomycetia bacterium]|nr:hypothetical protein [Planctomycetia bacterium]